MRGGIGNAALALLLSLPCPPDEPASRRRRTPPRQRRITRRTGLRSRLTCSGSEPATAERPRRRRRQSRDFWPTDGPRCPSRLHASAGSRPSSRTSTRRRMLRTLEGSRPWPGHRVRHPTRSFAGPSRPRRSMRSGEPETASVVRETSTGSPHGSATGPARTRPDPRPDRRGARSASTPRNPPSPSPPSRTARRAPARSDPTPPAPPPAAGRASGRAPGRAPTGSASAPSACSRAHG